MKLLWNYLKSQKQCKIPNKPLKFNKIPCNPFPYFLTSIFPNLHIFEFHIFILSNFHLLYFNVLCFHIFISPHFHISILSYFRVSTHPYFHIAEIFWPVLTYSDTSNLYLFWTGLSLWLSKWVSEWVKDMTSRKAIASKKLHHMQIEIVAHYLE